MPKKQPKRGRGRPNAADPMKHNITFRLNGAGFDALQKYRDRFGLDSVTVADSARDLVVKGLRREGYLA